MNVEADCEVIKPAKGAGQKTRSPFWALLRAAHYSVIRPLPDRLAHFAQVLTLRNHASFGRSVLDVAKVVNVLPNAGGVPYTKELPSARDLIDQMSDRRGQGRAQAIVGFEGFAPDDSVYDRKTEQWRIWSYSRLARWLSRFAYRCYPCPSVLELGCGGGQLFEFLRAYGIVNYVGIDGSPHFVAQNPFCEDNRHNFRQLNLQEEVQLSLAGRPVHFDIVCSFEVLEHIREDCVGYLLASIRSHLHESSLAFLTVSMLECDVHVLVRPRDWWLRKFSESGLLPHHNCVPLERGLGVYHPHIWNSRTSHVFALVAGQQRGSALHPAP